MIRKSPLLLFCLLVIGLVSCKKSDVDPGTGKEIVLTPAEQQRVAADNAFTLKLFKNLSGSSAGNTNLFTSPLSVSFAMGMVSNGAKGATLQSINNTMGFNGFSQAAINSYYSKLITELPQLDPNTKLNIANSIWYKQGFNVAAPFLETNTSAYQAQVKALDFGNVSASKAEINGWVNDKTSGKIPVIVDDISSDVVMYLINAIYFKSTWKNKFDAAKTKKLPFTLGDNSQVQADFMSGEIQHKRYYENVGDKTTIIAELTYANDRYSMVIVLPDESVKVKDLVAGLDSAKWVKWMAGLQQQTSPILLPKFKFAYDVTLNNALINLGMGDAFSINADFTGITPTGGIAISKVKQKAFVEVNEQGTEAAAATSVEIVLTSSAPKPELNINRPFLFAIREQKTGLILFTGVVNNPLLTGN